MAVKSKDAKRSYTDYLDRVSDAVKDALANGDTVSSVASRIGTHRSVIYEIMNGTYKSTMSAMMLLAFDEEFDLGIFK